jgi:hypothetical protein
MVSHLLVISKILFHYSQKLVVDHQKKKKKSLFCASKIPNCHIPFNSNMKISIFLMFKSEIPLLVLGKLLLEILSCLFSFKRTERELSSGKRQAW